MMEAKMFCYQCQETMKGTGCILKGVWKRKSYSKGNGFADVRGTWNISRY